jgi:hypothetical protein
VAAFSTRKNRPRDHFVALFGHFVAFFVIFIGSGAVASIDGPVVIVSGVPAADLLL